MDSEQLSRRDLIAALASGAATTCGARSADAEDVAEGPTLSSGPQAPLSAHPARWWKAAADKRIDCRLCPHGCRVSEGKRGACGVRENRGGRYHTLVHARPCAIHVDPIEKKPFYHVLPGRTALSVGVPGCNLRCKFCQNWEISQVRPEQIRTFDKSPAAVVRLAQQRGSPTIACTYTEPVVWSEYVYDIGAAAQQAGLRTLMVSNGFIQPQPMTDLLGVLSAVKIDLKAYTEDFYRNQCQGRLAPVLATLRLLAKKNVWTEIVVLVIPGLNDSEREVRALARFVRDELGPDRPLHFSRFHPQHRLRNVPRTPVATLTRARNTALAEGLRFVYVGNVPGHRGNNTYCPGCGKVVVRRVGMAVVKNRLRAGQCPDCGRRIPGIWA